MFPGMWVRIVSVRPDTSVPLTVPLSTCQESTPSHVPPSGSSPTQHGQRILHVHTSSSFPSSSYAISTSLRRRAASLGESRWRRVVGTLARRGVLLAVRLERLLRGGLLSVLLRPPDADSGLLPVHHGRAGEAAVVGRALDGDDLVRDRRVPPRQLLLQRGLEVDVLGGGILDSPREGLDDRLRNPLEPVLEKERGEGGLHDCGQDVAVARELRRLLDAGLQAPIAQPAIELELQSDRRTARAGADVREDLRHPALGEVRVAVEEVAGDGEIQDAVAEELEPFVGGGAVGRPVRMRKDLIESLPWERLDQVLELVRFSRRRAAI